MNNRELDEILKRVPFPERPVEYWEEFPGRVRRQLRSPRERARGFEGRRVVPRFPPAWGIGLALVCIVIAWAVGFRSQKSSPTNAQQLSQVRKYFREIEALFPNQVQAITFDQQGAHLTLAPEANVPSSPALYLKVCGAEGCQRFITFSGQQIRIRGQLCEVLADRDGGILLVGRDFLWSSSAKAGDKAAYRIEAKPLEGTS
ncbi:MAG: hypothetical protein QOJ40_2851 [Verrucomicrobiota bacterium]